MPLACSSRRRASSNTGGTFESTARPTSLAPARRTGRTSAAPDSRFSAPTGGEIDMSLSLRITSRSMSGVTPALFIASKAMPAVIAPSPITATWRRRPGPWFSPLLRDATAMPSAAEIDVDECAVPKVSYSDSLAARKAGDAAVLAQAVPSGRAVRSGSCADSSGGRRPRRAGRAGCRTRSAARSSARPCRGWTTDGRRSATPNRAGSARSSSASSAAAAAGRAARSVARIVDAFQQRSWSASFRISAARCSSASSRRRRARRAERAQAAVRASASASRRASCRRCAAQAQQRHVGRLVVGGVLAGGLAQRRGVALDVEDVVDHLEREADRICA